MCYCKSTGCHLAIEARIEQMLIIKKNHLFVATIATIRMKINCLHCIGAQIAIFLFRSISFARSQFSVSL